MAAVIEACKAGSKVVDICEKGDSIMVECVPQRAARGRLCLAAARAAGEQQHPRAAPKLQLTGTATTGAARARRCVARPCCGCWQAAGHGASGCLHCVPALGLRLAGQHALLPARLCRGVGKEFKGKEIEKGIAVPTCISVNK